MRRQRVDILAVRDMRRIISAQAMAVAVLFMAEFDFLTLQIWDAWELGLSCLVRVTDEDKAVDVFLQVSAF